MLPLEFKPADNIGAPLIQHPSELEQEAGDKGGLCKILTDHFAGLYRMTWPSAKAA